MKPLFLEKQVWLAWRDRVGFPRVTRYETSARRAFLRFGGGVSESLVLDRICKANVVAFGDDRWVSEDQEVIGRFLARTEGPYTFLTDRHFETGAHPVSGLPRRFRWRRIRPANNLQESDRRLALVVADERRQGRRVVIWTGALRLAPTHLPREVLRIEKNAFFLVLEAAESRWASGSDKGYKALDRQTVAWLGRSPLLSLENFRLRHAGISVSPVSVENLTRTFDEAARKISARVGVRRPPPPKTILHPFSSEMFRYLGRNRGSAETRTFLWDRVVRGESAVIPRERIVLISALDTAEIAEESAHFIRLGGGKRIVSDPLEMSLEEAFAFLASRWIHARRPLPPQGVGKEDRWERLHRLGYLLGHRLHQRWRSSPRVRSRIRELWRVRTDTPQQAREVWNALERIV